MKTLYSATLTAELTRRDETVFKRVYRLFPTPEAARADAEKELDEWIRRHAGGDHEIAPETTSISVNEFEVVTPSEILSYLETFFRDSAGEEPLQAEAITMLLKEEGLSVSVWQVWGAYLLLSRQPDYTGLVVLRPIGFQEPK